MNKFKSINKMFNNHQGIITVIGIFLTIILSLFIYYLDTQRIDISGKWDVKFITEESSMNSYEGLKTGYIINIQHVDKSITGKGEKWTLNNEFLPYEQHDQITIEGKLLKGDLKFNFDLYGSRKTTGQIQAEISKDKNSFEGTFTGTGANVSGQVYGIKKK